MRIEPYEHKVQYYETDQMQAVHHSNYIRWFEEGRNAALDRLGFSYARMEAMGIASPITAISAEYKSMARFGETVILQMHVTAYNGVTMTLSYKVTDKATGALRCRGESTNCFVNREGRLISPRRSCPEIHELLSGLVEPMQE